MHGVQNGHDLYTYLVSNQNAESVDRRTVLDERQIADRRRANPHRRPKEDEPLAARSLDPGKCQYLVLLGLMKSIRWSPPTMYSKSGKTLLNEADRRGKVRRWLQGCLSRTDWETSFQTRQFNRAVDFLFALNLYDEVHTAIMHMLANDPQFLPYDDDDDEYGGHDFSNGHPE